MTAGPPIIIIGAARSGTKFLRGILASSPGASAVPFDVSYIWRYGNQFHKHDVLKPNDLTPRIMDFIQSELPKLASIQDGSDERLIEKTVANCLRVGFVNEVYPNAKFIHLVRDGRAVTESAIRMWQQPPDRGGLWEKLKSLPFKNYDYAFWFFVNYLTGLASGRGGGKVWGPRYPGIDQDIKTLPLERVCAKQWSVSVAAAHQSLNQLNPARVLTVRYENLVNDASALSRIIDFLDLPNPELVRAAYNASVRSNNNEKWRHNLSPEQQQMAFSEIEDTMALVGYKMVENQ